MELKKPDKDDESKGYPSIVYKYRDWGNSKHRSILQENELFLSSPANFNDPFDCRIVKDFSLLDTKEKIKKYVDKITIETYDHWVNKSATSVQSMMADFERRLQDLQKVQEEYDAYLYQQEDLYYGIICLSAIWNDILMWSHYANCHQGFVIGFYEKPLRDFASTQGAGGMMIYDSSFPRLDPLEDIGIRELFLMRHYKSSQWSYEAEYRVSKLFYPEVPSLEDRKIHFPDSFIAEVILGLNMAKEHAEEIISTCRTRKIPVYKARKIPFRFQITCDPL